MKDLGYTAEEIDRASVSNFKVEFRETDLKSKVIRPNETEYVKCSNCDKDLMQIAINKISDTIFYKLVVDCPFCGDKSWEIDIRGKIGVRPCDQVAMLNIVKDNDKVIYKTRRNNA